MFKLVHILLSLAVVALSQGCGNSSSSRRGGQYDQLSGNVGIRDRLYLSWPVPRYKRVSQRFAPRSNRRHAGLDITGNKGTPIVAAHDGVVVYAGHAFSGYGNMVIVEFNHQWGSLYAHLNSVSVREGQRVSRGDKLGGMGRTGRVTGVHLHFELIKDRQPIDPLKYLRIP